MHNVQFVPFISTWASTADRIGYKYTGKPFLCKDQSVVQLHIDIDLLAGTQAVLDYKTLHECSSN